MPFGWIDNLCGRLPGIFAGEPAGGPKGRRQTRGAQTPQVRAGVRPALGLLTALAMLLSFMSPSPALPATAGPDVPIVNSAWLTSNESSSAVASVTVIKKVRTSSELEFFRYIPTAAPASVQVPIVQGAFSTNGSLSGPFASLPLPAYGNQVLSLGAPLPLVAGQVFHQGEPVFLQLRDADQNLDDTTVESVVVSLLCNQTGDSEVVRLYETAPDSGIFSGYLPTASEPGTAGNGVLSVDEGCSIEARYLDLFDAGDISVAAALVDPFGIVFDSGTGLPVDGAVVTLIDADTGQPAQIWGDDGIADFPTSLVSGGSATDGNGTSYSFPPGGFRFPFIAPGNYRLQIEPPAGYAAPSSVADADLQALAGAPYALASGSRGEDFTVNAGPAVHIDIPVDPAVTGLWVRKETGKALAAPGDFIPYQIRVENFDQSVTSPAVSLSDRLPLGLRYEQGSVRIDGGAASDPDISADGRTLSFSLGDLAAGETRQVTYVAAVMAGARQGEAINTASATDAHGTVSNEAAATIQIRDDLLRSRAILAGRVLNGSCAEEDIDLEGLAGVRIYLEDGSFVVTDEQGMYHFEGITPGSHVVQLDLDTLAPQYEVLPCAENDRFAGSAYSQFVDVQGGTLWRADFHVGLRPKASGEVSLQLNSSLAEDVVHFGLPLRVGDVPVRQTRLEILLPEGLEYLPGSSILNDLPLAEPRIAGGTLTFDLGDCPASWNGEMALRCRVDTSKSAQLTSQARLLFATPGQSRQFTPTAENLLRVAIDQSLEPVNSLTIRPRFDSFVTELSKQDRALLDTVVEQLRGENVAELYVTGHTDDVRIAERSRHIFPDNFALSAGRARSVARYLGDALSLPPGAITVVGMGKAAPLASNAASEGRALNRRVEVRYLRQKSESSSELSLLKDRSGEKKVNVTGLRPGETWTAPGEPAAPSVAQNDPGILSPGDGAHLPTRTHAVRIRLDSRLKPKLLLDGEEVSSERIGFTLKDPEKGTTLYSYIGVDFDGVGEHQLRLEGLGPFGNARFKQEFSVLRTGEIAEIRLIEAGGNIADGITPVRVRLALLDASGNRIEAPAVLNLAEGDLRPHTVQKGGLVVASDEPGVQVSRDGTVLFQPVSRSGRHRARLIYNGAELDLDIDVKPHLRDWIMVGIADGTAGYNTLSGNMEALGAHDLEEDFYGDGRVAFFAKGKVKGEWLLTVAYDSEKEKRDSLHQIIDPDSYYTLYGDGTAQGYEAASAEKLFVKLERDQFHALFGDFESGLTTTELSRYSRSLTGVKTEMTGKRFEFKAFASDTGQSYVKDEIHGDGTSGLYRLSRRELVLNSEKVTIETRDRFRSELVLESRQLLRHVDYDIDYDDGSLFFKEPVASRDDGFNPIFIIVEYETNESRGEFLNYGGRAAVKFFDERLVVGGSYIREEQGLKEGDLIGIDAALQLSEHTQLRAELASSDSEEVGVSQSGTAMLAELKHDSKELRGSLYMREQEEDFGLGQQRGSESGTRKYGVEAGWQISDEIGVEGEAFRQETLATGAERDLVEAKTHFKRQGYDAELGLRQATDRFTDGTRNESLQLTSAASVRRLEERLTLRARHDQTLDHSAQSADYPTRTTLGADYRLTERLSIFAAQEFTAGENEDSEGTRAGFKATPWNGAQMNSDVERRLNENGARVSANLGLTQKFQLTERWSLDASLDRSQTLRHPGNTPVNPNAAPASGSDNDFTAVSFGAAHKRQNWLWNGRAEWRTSDTDDKWTLASGLVVETRPGVAYSNRVRLHRTETRAGARTADAEVRFGMAWRPKESRWIVLDRLDLLANRQSGVDLSFRNWRLVNNLNANFRPNRRTQIALQYGAKYVQETIFGTDYSGFTDLVGLETRYDLSKRWDIGLRGSALHSWNGGQFDYSSGASVGYSMVKNVWLSLGYNLTGFRDDDFSAAGYTAQGPYLRFRMKFDQHSIRPALRWFTGS